MFHIEFRAEGFENISVGTLWIWQYCRCPWHVPWTLILGCRCGDFCRYIECPYKEGWLYEHIFYGDYFNMQEPLTSIDIYLDLVMVSFSLILKTNILIKHHRQADAFLLLPLAGGRCSWPSFSIVKRSCAMIDQMHFNFAGLGVDAHDHVATTLYGLVCVALVSPVNFTAWGHSSLLAHRFQLQSPIYLWGMIQNGRILLLQTHWPTC